MPPRCAPSSSSENGALRLGELLVNDFEGDGSIVPEIVGEVHGRGAASTEEREASVRLPLDPVSVRQCGREALMHRFQVQ